MNNSITESGLNEVERFAKIFAESRLTPPTFRGNNSDCLVMVYVANSMGVDPITAMNSLVEKDGEFSWRTEFIISKVLADGFVEGVNVEEEDGKYTVTFLDRLIGEQTYEFSPDMLIDSDTYNISTVFKNKAISDYAKENYPQLLCGFPVAIDSKFKKDTGPLEIEIDSEEIDSFEDEEA